MAPSATTTALTSSVNPSAVDQHVTFTAVVSPASGSTGGTGGTGISPGGGPSGGSSTGTPTGTVTFFDGPIVLGTASLSVVNGQDEAALDTASLTAGSHIIAAVYSGDSNIDGSSASLTQAVIDTSIEVWTGAAGDSLWGNGGNWDTGLAPNSNSDVVIPAGTPLAVAGGTVAIHNLALEGSLEADGTFSANDVTLDGGSLTGDGFFSVGEALTWTGGRMVGSGTISISLGADLTLSGASPKTLDGWTLENEGTATWGGGDIEANGATILNESGATFTLEGSPNLADDSGTSTIVNSGTFTKSSDDGESDIGASFLNGDDGTAAVNGGMLGLGNGGSSSGTFQLAPGAKLGIKGGVFGLGGLVLGTGQLVIGTGTDTPATVTVDTGTTNVQNLVLLPGGTLDGFGEVDVGAGLQSGGGAIRDRVKVVVDQVASFSITGWNSKELTGAKLINNGTATWDGGSLVLHGDAEFHNTGSITATGDLGLGVPDGALGTFFNEGGQFIQTSGTLTVNVYQLEATAGSSFTIQAGAAISFLSTVGGTLAGSITAAAGTQVLFGGGTWNLTPTTTFGGAATYSLQAGAKLSVAGGASVHPQNFVMSGGFLDGGGDIGANSFTWTGGTMQGTGRTYEFSGDLMTISGGTAGDGGDSHTIDTRTLLNLGTIIWQSGAGDILLAGGANIVNDGSGGEGVFEAWPDSTILPDDPATTTSSFTVRDGGKFIKPSDEYNGWQWTSVKVLFENDSGTVQVNGALAVTDYEQPFGLTQVSGLGIFTITSPETSVPRMGSPGEPLRFRGHCPSRGRLPCGAARAS